MTDPSTFIELSNLVFGAGGTGGAILGAIVWSRSKDNKNRLTNLENNIYSKLNDISERLARMEGRKDK